MPAPLPDTATPRTLRLTVLGSGTSMGVPTVGCECAVCRSADPRDNRTRASILLSFAGRNVVVDTTPDFRQQVLRAGVKRLDAVVFTHGHADHILGLDDVRPFNLKQQAALPVYGSPETLAVLRRTFAYIFDGAPSLSTVPSVQLHEIEGPLRLFGVELLPVPAEHGGMQVLGFRFGRAAYLTDFSRVPESSKQLLRGLDDLILDALRYTPHPMHSTIDQSLGLLAELQPRRAWFTHMSHDVSHEDANARLAAQPGPTEVRLAYDGLAFDVALTPRIEVFHSPLEWAAGTRAGGQQRPAVVTIGNFDGLHLGHRRILEGVLRHARAVTSSPLAPAHSVPVAGVVTFDPHPLRMLRPAEAPPLIATLEQRITALESLGLDAVMVLPFTEALSRLSAKEFVLEVLVNQLCVRQVLVGANFRFGHKQSGDVNMLKGLGQQFGFGVEAVPPVELDGEVVSSTAVRRAVNEGDVARAARLLGEPMMLTGRVARGQGQGRKDLVPTLNLAPEQELLPRNGVYVTESTVEAETFPSVTNIGVRPTVDGSRLAVESHLLGFSRTITAGRMEVRFHARLRDEQKFPSLDALRAQIQEDIAAARTFFHLR
jgi:phosphoribosyl 1,2-cyclic phosphate phosphodiesterase